MTLPPGVALAFRAPEVAKAATLTTALHLAVDTGLLDALAEGVSARSDELAVRCGLTPRGTAALLAALTAAGVLVRSPDGRFASCTSATDAQALLGRGEGLGEVLRGGAGRQPPGGYVAVAPLLAELTASWAEDVAAQLGGLGEHLLDLGSGASAVGRAWAAAAPGRRVTAVDQPEVLAVLREALARDGLEGRFTLLPGDLRTLALPTGVDVVLLSGVLHLFPDEEVRRALHRAAAALRPGGTLAVVEALLDEDLSGPLPTALYALDLHRRVPEGGIWPQSQLAAWMVAAGFQRVLRRQLERDSGWWLLTARSGT